jgi:hypothetical protein
MNIKAAFSLQAMALVILLFIGTVIWTGCGRKTPPAPPPPPPTNTQPATPPPERLSDLQISAIEVFPAEPIARQPFAVNVFVKNAGQATSGQYDLEIFIKDVSRAATYPVGTFRQGPLKPGENVAAYSSTDRQVNYPGSHQLQAEIKPFQFEDGNIQNNTAIRAFTVK